MRYKIQVFIIFLLAPFIGLGIAYAKVQPFSLPEMETLALKADAFQEEAEIVSGQMVALKDSLQELQESAETTGQLIRAIRQSVSAEQQAYEEQHAYLQDLLVASLEQRKASLDVLDTVLANLLGDPVGQTFGQNATIKVYSLEEAGYRGYMAKVRLHNPRAVRMVLAGDSIENCKGETTSEAAKRTGAVLAVNAGGFYAHEGRLLPVGITVIDGEVVTFSTYDPDLSFIGFNRSGQLVGGRIETMEELLALDVLHGASFLPTLLKDGKKQPIPAAWANTRHPRTMIGHFENGDLLFIVIDGRRQGWSIGVTLEEAQEKLLEFKVRDAYNLDGGGSSTFYYNGQVLNRPSDGRERKVTTNIVVLP